jgi:hypothetical protein
LSFELSALSIELFTFVILRHDLSAYAMKCPPGAMNWRFPPWAGKDYFFKWEYRMSLFFLRTCFSFELSALSLEH